MLAVGIVERICSHGSPDPGKRLGRVFLRPARWTVLDAARVMVQTLGTLAARFARAVRDGGWRHALYESARGLLRRTGAASSEDLSLLRDEVRALGDALTRARPRRLRVLYALEFFPHASESYIATEIAWMRREGVEIEAWSEREPPVPDATDVVVHRGTLAAAIADCRPHVVHGHHLEQALGYAPTVTNAGLPMTVRAHGFALTDAKLAAIDASTAITAVFHFPHMLGPAARAPSATIRPMTVCFDPALCHPSVTKDPRLVVRTGLASPTKDLAMFLRLAARFPRHRFVLLPCWSYGAPAHLDELQRLNRDLGTPAEILPNLSHRDVAGIVQSAGVYLHTHALIDEYGMPISIAEAMATGCHVIARRGPSTADYVGDAGRLYDTEDEAAALLSATESWDEAQWRHTRLAAIERAFGTFAAPVVLGPLLTEWRRLAARRT